MAEPGSTGGSGPDATRDAAAFPTAGPGTPHLTRGFLFADLRDYTGYVEAHGDHAGAALLERYRALVRGAVAAGGGAEIRTEGDSFYVVFDSASAAVRAGQAIIAAAEAARGDPIRVGVGVHAGETVETAEGFVGSAVNIAARLCTQARAGELVVSETVRALTRTYLDVDFEPLGARRLKGVAEPMALFRVVPHGKGRTRPPNAGRIGARRTWWIAAGAVALVVLAAVGYAATAGRPSSSPAAPAGAAAANSGGATTSSGASAGGSAPAGSSSTPPTASPSIGPFPNAAEAAILASLPGALAKTCVRGGTADDARLAGFTGVIEREPYTLVDPVAWLAGVTCYPATGATRFYVMAPVAPGMETNDNSFPTAPGDVYLGYLASARRLPFGSCATDARAEESWVGPTGSGLLACMNPYDGRPWIYFTFDKGTYLAFATRDDSNYATLYQWWVGLKIFLP